MPTPLPLNAALTPTPADRLQTYLAHRRPLELLFWVAVSVLQATANTATVWQDVQRAGLRFALWEVACWEWSSNLVWLALVPLVLHVLQRWPLHWGVLRAHLAWHGLASLGVSAIHVACMVAARKVVYAAHGSHYDFGPWFTEWLYEAIKDVRAYALIIITAVAYQLLLWRLQGEATLLQKPDEAPPPASGLPQPPVAEALDRPERFLVKKLGKEYLLPTAEIAWVQACGNYVNLHRQGHDYPLRSSLTALEKRLDGGRFVRVHRGWVVNLALVEAIEPTENGDARLRMQGGGAVPCSRTFLEGLRARLH